MSLWKDEASILKTQNIIKRIEPVRCLGEIIKIVEGSANLDMYAFLISSTHLYSGRTGTSVIKELPKDLQQSLRLIWEKTTKKGNFVEYLWRTAPLEINYIKRSYVKFINIDGERFVVGSGYPVQAYIDGIDTLK